MHAISATYSSKLLKIIKITFKVRINYSLEVDFVAAPLNGFPRFNSRLFISVAENLMVKQVQKLNRVLTTHIVDSTKSLIWIKIFKINLCRFCLYRRFTWSTSLLWFRFTLFWKNHLLAIFWLWSRLPSIIVSGKFSTKICVFSIFSLLFELVESLLRDRVLFDVRLYNISEEKSKFLVFYRSDRFLNWWLNFWAFFLLFFTRYFGNWWLFDF